MGKKRELEKERTPEVTESDAASSFEEMLGYLCLNFFSSELVFQFDNYLPEFTLLADVYSDLNGRYQSGFKMKLFYRNLQ